MSAVPQANLIPFLDYQSFILHMRDVVNGSKVIQALFRTSQEEWDRSFDANDRDRHLIQGVFTSPQKSEAVRIYIAKIVKLHMISTGSRLTAWTKDTVAGENPTNVAISNRIAAIEFKNNRELFKIVASRLLGFDDALIAFALEDDVDTRAKLMMDYLSAQFDLSVGTEKPHTMYIDQTVDLSILLKTDGFTPEFFAAHLYQAMKYFEAFEGVAMNHWDLFDILDVVVQVNQEHADTSKLYDELTTAAAAAAAPDASVFELLIDQDDPDPSTTIEVCSQQYPGLEVVLPKDIDYSSEFKQWLIEFAAKQEKASRPFSVRQIASAYNYTAPIQSLGAAHLL
jgi:hypothetical protein